MRTDGDAHQGLENVTVLYLTQAMLGLVARNVRAVSVEVGRRVVVHFALSQATPSDGETVEGILTDLDALMDNEDDVHVDEIASVVHIGQVDASWPGISFRRVYEAKPDTSA